MDSLMAGQEKAWDVCRPGSGESSLFSLATSLASVRSKSSLLSIVSVTDESELPLDVAWVSLGSDEEIEATSEPQMLVELVSESESSVSKWVAPGLKNLEGTTRRYKASEVPFFAMWNQLE